MADDQVKYSDLIAQDVQPGLTMLAEALKAVTEQIASLKTEATALKGAMSAAGTATREQQQATAQQAASVEGLSKKVKQLTEEERRLEDVRKRYKKLTDEQIERVNAFQQALRGSTQQQMAAVNAIEVETKSYNELNAMYNALKDSLNAMTVAERQNTEAGKAMTMQSAKIYDTMNELQKATGKYTLQVGKYRAAFDGLGYSFQQILREAPSALNLNQFFLAISNNVPQFIDQLKSFRNEQAEIKANLAQMTEGTKEYAEQLGKVESVGKKLGKVLFSWQSLVLVGLMVLRNMDRIIAGINSLFSNLTKEQKMLKAVNEEASSSIGDMTAKYVALQNEWKNLKAEDMPGWLEQHKNDWSELGRVIDNAKEAEDFYVNNTAAVQEAIDKRARSIAAMKIAAEKYEEAFNKEVEAENAVANRSASTWNRVKQILMGFSGAKYSWTRNYLEKTIEEDAKEYAEDMREEAKALREEATNLITKFVLPEEESNTKKGAKQKESKEDVFDFTPKDVNDQYWKAERTRIDLMEDGLKKELELQKLAHAEALEQNDVYYADREEQLMDNLMGELKLITKGNDKAADEMYNAIVRNDTEAISKMGADAQQLAQKYWSDIEEGERQHDIIMQDLDVQNERTIKAIRMKNLADEWKDNAKNRLKAAVDGWAEYKAKLVEEGKTRKQIVEAEVAAEIARLNLMLKLNRDVNGEIMSDEQKAKVQEWINLLEKLQQTGNYGDYKPGQFMGKGGANVTNERKNYANIWEVLGIDMDNNQVSALNSVFDQAKEALNSWMDARKAAADQAKELADDEVSAAENALNREIELRNQGYANDVALREKELADAKAAQEKAVEEQKKIAGEQILLDAAMQTSSLITASANIWKQFATQPLLAIAMLGTMWGSFLYAKTKAYQVSQKSIKFKEGGVMLLEGGSHESGHDVNLGVGPDGSNLRAEGGEYFAVINKRSSRKYGSQIPAVVNALNSGMFEDRYIKTSDAVGLLPQVIRADNGSYVDLSKVEGGVSELVKQGEQNWTIEGDYRVLRYKNLTRRVKIG